MSNLFSFRSVWLLAGVAATYCMLGDARVSAQGWQGSNGPPSVYQPNVIDWNRHDDRRDDRRDRRDSRRDSRIGRRQTEISSGWFQRPYPYHLDYYKMRFSGPPYAGNTYGTPGVSYPAYYGPYYTGYGWPIDARDAAYPGMTTSGTEVEGSTTGQTVTGQTPTTQPQTKSSGETLPAPKSQ